MDANVDVDMDVDTDVDTDAWEWVGLPMQKKKGKREKIQYVPLYVPLGSAVEYSLFMFIERCFVKHSNYDYLPTYLPILQQT